MVGLPFPNWTRFNLDGFILAGSPNIPGGSGMERRDFLKSMGIAAGALAGAGASPRPSFALDAADDPVPGPQPNILFILVDELRFPSVFPAGVNSVDEFLSRFMPNVHS